jgi:hypothetical protein
MIAGSRRHTSGGGSERPSITCTDAHINRKTSVPVASGRIAPAARELATSVSTPARTSSRVAITLTSLALYVCISQFVLASLVGGHGEECRPRSSEWSATDRTARALNSSSYLLGMLRITFPRKKVCIKPGVVQLRLSPSPIGYQVRVYIFGRR